MNRSGGVAVVLTTTLSILVAIVVQVIGSPLSVPFLVAEAYDQSIEDCRRVASQFSNTCENPSPGDYSKPASSVAEMTSTTVSCTPQFKCIENGTQNGNTCSWERKLCVTCRVDSSTGKTKIRIQTNNLPNHCVKSISIKPNNFDFEVNFNSKETFGTWETTITTQTELDDAVCPIRKTFHTAEDLGLVEFGDSESQNAMAIAINGVAFQFANQIREDPVYPITELNEQPLDLCLGHNQLNSDYGMYHYHDISPCINPTFLEGKTMNSCVDDPTCAANKTAWMLSGFASGEWNDRKVIGIGKDGHILYGPYRTAGKLWESNEVDACNGAWSDDRSDYFYVGTRWHPYGPGCEGPSNFPQVNTDTPLYANCSLNGLSQYVFPVLGGSVSTTAQPSSGGGAEGSTTTTTPSINPTAAPTAVVSTATSTTAGSSSPATTSPGTSDDYHQTSSSRETASAADGTEPPSSQTTYSPGERSNSAATTTTTTASTTGGSNVDIVDDDGDGTTIQCVQFCNVANGAGAMIASSSVIPLLLLLLLLRF